MDIVPLWRLAGEVFRCKKAGQLPIQADCRNQGSHLAGWLAAQFDGVYSLQLFFSRARMGEDLGILLSSLLELRALWGLQYWFSTARGLEYLSVKVDSQLIIFAYCGTGECTKIKILCSGMIVFYPCCVW